MYTYTLTYLIFLDEADAWQEAWDIIHAAGDLHTLLLLPNVSISLQWDCQEDWEADENVTSCCTCESGPGRYLPPCFSGFANQTPDNHS